jgi:hypothetical protein
VSTSDLVATVTELEPERVLVGRALDPVLRADLAVSIDYEELPFVRGRTVIPADLTTGDLVIAGHPNFLGIFDLPAAPNWLGVTGRWSALVSTTGMIKGVPVATPVGLAEAEAALAAVLGLVKQLDQLRGVTVAFAPMSPVAVVLLTADPVRIASQMAMSGCTPLTGYDELPGGLRIEPGTAERGAGLEEYAATLAEAMRSVT